MRFHAPYVSGSAAGDYYQLYLGPDDSDDEQADPFEVKGPYLIVQRQFEMFDSAQCYIETCDEEYVGHFPLKLIELSRTRLAFEIERKTNTRVDISFELSASEFVEIRQVAEIVFGLTEPNLEDDDDAL